jgi:GTP 3',8-cyclase
MLTDTWGRPVEDLRISVTDRCNFRCSYCMPLDRYDWIDRKEILSFEEITKLAEVFVSLGVSKIRLTGGEPLLRRNLDVLVRELAGIPGISDLCLTTNGALLQKMAAGLAAAGLKRLNVSLDTLDEEKFEKIAGRKALTQVLEGLAEAKSCGLGPIKINAVIERGLNDDEIIPIAEYARKNSFAVRFIEFMDVGNVNGWKTEKIVPKREILQRLHAWQPLRESKRKRGSAPALDYEYEDGSGTVGMIASVTEPFCGACTRARLTADGKLVTCLFSDQGHDMKAMIREGRPESELRERIASIWAQRTDRYSEQRLVLLNDSPSRRKIEMIRLGG